MFQVVSLIFLGVMASPKQIMLFAGLGGGFKNQEIMEFGFSGLSNNEIGIVLYQSEAD